MNKSIKNNSIVGVVLAGGLSSRLGQDKARLSLENNEDLLLRSVRIMLEAVDKVLVVGRQVPELQNNSRVECLQDDWPGYGPVGGITTALKYSGSDCLVISCDLPFMTSELILGLTNAWESRQNTTLLYAYAQAGTKKVENLVGIYAQQSLPFLQESVNKKLLKIALCIAPERQELLEYNFDASLPFFNINYPADLLLAREYLRFKKTL